LEKTFETLNREVDICSRVVMTAKDQSMNGPKHQRELLRLVKVSDTLSEINEGLERLVVTTEEELEMES
jgi:hypothetical protein